MPVTNWKLFLLYPNAGLLMKLSCTFTFSPKWWNTGNTSPPAPIPGNALNTLHQGLRTPLLLPGFNDPRTKTHPVDLLKVQALCEVVIERSIGKHIDFRAEVLVMFRISMEDACLRRSVRCRRSCLRNRRLRQLPIRLQHIHGRSRPRRQKWDRGNLSHQVDCSGKCFAILCRLNVGRPARYRTLPAGEHARIAQDLLVVRCSIDSVL